MYGLICDLTPLRSFKNSAGVPLALWHPTFSPAMLLHRFSRIATLLLALAWLPASQPARADSSAGSGNASASVTFTIHIPVVLRMKVDSPPTLRVTAEDVARGYVETAAAQNVLITYNARREYTLRFDVRTTGFSRVTVSGQQTSLSFGPEGLSLQQPPTSPTTSQSNFRFNYRFDLAPGMAAGEYPWPLALALTQL